MKAIVEKNRYRTSLRAIKSAVFVDSPLSDAIDVWFDKHRVWELAFKCATWNKLKRKVQQLESAAIATALETTSDLVKWNHRAGCACGCSPGYLVQGGYLLGRDIWIKFENCEDELQQINNELPYYDRLLAKELARHTNTSVAAV